MLCRDPVLVRRHRTRELREVAAISTEGTNDMREQMIDVEP
jgi:hypothetical protein